MFKTNIAFILSSYPCNILQLNHNCIYIYAFIIYHGLITVVVHNHYKYDHILLEQTMSKKMLQYQLSENELFKLY
jgi:hypothetical protein